MSGRFFIDLFAGCGGLSLGLAESGWRGRFAIERDPMAFETLSANFLGPRSDIRFDWPAWLKPRPWAIDELLARHGADLRKLRGQVQMVAGGPPCQGFSFAGRRRKNDPRNMLFKKYVEVVDAVRPEVLLVENVLGMKVVHGSNSRPARNRGRGRPPEAYSDRLARALSELEYDVTSIRLDAEAFGVPQRRPRLLVLGVRRNTRTEAAGGVQGLVGLIEDSRRHQLKTLGLKPPISSRDAIGDLETGNDRIRDCRDPASPGGFKEPLYFGPRTHYQRLMRGSSKGNDLDSARLARHTDVVRERFAKIIQECRQGVAMHVSDRNRLGLSKLRIHPMSGDLPAPTITTLPDDILHYAEPRILSVRECARLQSFPDWFVFRGKYTTGGHRRVKECPRYTQVGNAVPPLLGCAIGRAADAFLDMVEAEVPRKRLASG